jgi:S-adenosylmethionine decarboxylase
MDTFGTHLLAEMYGCDREALASIEIVRSALMEAAAFSGNTVLAEHFVELQPGISGAVIISESHLSVHTWPEERYASVDIYTCHKNSNTLAALNLISDYFAPVSREVLFIYRGLSNGLMIKKIESRDKPTKSPFESELLK